MNKKLVLIAIVTVVCLIIGFAIYEIVRAPVSEIKNLTDGVKIETVQDDKNSINVNINNNGGVKAEPTTGQGKLLVCQEKCGDGFCQESDAGCKNEDLNCICLEKKQDCPQDCK